jgi:methylenetetrahydrofolate reductase (NADPH)
MSQFEELITKTKEQVFTAEFPVIDGEGFAKVEKYAKRLKPWFVAVNATDNTAAHAHASNVASAIAMKMHGIEPIMQVVCRDKNRLAIQSDIVGASLHGIENICALTGDDVTAGDETEARRVFDLDGPQLVRLATTIGRGEYMSGRKIEPAPHLFVGAVENPSAPPFEKFCQGVVAAGLDRHVALLPTIVLIKGVRPLKFMNEKVPGISVPQDVIDRVEKASDQAEEAYQQTLEFSKHALSLPGVRGLHVTDFRHDETLDRLMTDLGRTPRSLN